MAFKFTDLCSFSIMCWILFTRWIVSTSQDSSPTEEHLYTNRSTLIKSLFENYDGTLPPDLERKPTDVLCELFINSFDSINVKTMDYKIDIFLRRIWKDHRLAFNSSVYNTSEVIIDMKSMHKVWTPDIFFSNEKQAIKHEVTIPNKLLRLYANGTLLFSERYSMTMSCPLDLVKFPMDTQSCSIVLESFMYTNETVRLTWGDRNPLDIKEGLVLPQFVLDQEEIKYRKFTNTYKTGYFSCLEITLKLRRRIGFYAINAFLPSCLIVGLSWVSFWINSDSVPARISLGLLTVLTMTTHSNSMRSDLPPVSYIKAIDVWTSACSFFVFAALLEFSVVNVRMRREVRRWTMKRKNSSAGEANGEKADALPSSRLKKRDSKHDACASESPRRSSPKSVFQALNDVSVRKVDKISRWLFPLAFLIFNIAFWTTYSVLEDK